MPHGRRIPVIGDIPAAPGAPGPGQGGAPAPTQGFGPRQRAKRLLRQGAGLQPASDVQPTSGLPPAIEALLNLQLAGGLLSQEKFEARISSSRVPTSAVLGASRRPPGRPAPLPRRGPALTTPMVSTGPVQPRRITPTGSNLAPGVLPASGEVVGARLNRAFARRPFLF